MKKILIVLLLLLAVSVSVNVWQYRQPQPETTIVTDTVWRDSIIREPVASETIKTSRVVYLRVPMPGDTVTDTVRDSILVPIPIMQKRYDDSLYTAWVSGYDPALDSINLHLPEVTTTVTRTITKPAPRLSIGVQGGAGYGIITRKPDIYVGFGATLRLWP